MREVDSRWSGVLNSENINAVADQIRTILAGRFAIAVAHYCDSQNAQLEMTSADTVIDSDWTTEPRNEPVRVFRGEGRPAISFSAGGYLWSFHGREDRDMWNHEDYNYAYFHFEHNKFKVIERAPAGKGCLHQRVFAAHRTKKEDE